MTERPARLPEKYCTEPKNDGRMWETQCARCGSSACWEECEYCCGEGFVGHDCGDDCCVCIDPEDNIPCPCCRGRGGWWTCVSGREYCDANPLPGREGVKRGVIEWFALPSRGSSGPGGIDP